MRGSVGRSFRSESIHHLRDEYLPRLDTALRALPDEDLWWAPHAGCASAGNLLLHLEGNVRQWLLSGLGGAEDRRDRPAEFAAREGATKQELLDAIQATVREACAVIETIDKTRLLERTSIQGFTTTGLAAIYHVVEHFAWHVAQIVWISKLRAGPEHGITFYDDDALNETNNQPSAS